MTTATTIGTPRRVYWYRDNWTGATRIFRSFTEAKSAAAKETGGFITIWAQGGWHKVVPASGHCPS